MKTIIITAGDPLGIGPEITVKVLKRFKNKNADTAFIVIGDKEALLANGWMNKYGVIIDIKSKFKKPAAGKHAPSKWGGDISFKALETAVKMMLAGKGSALVTAPVSKEAWAKAGIKFTGHTEFLKHYAAKNKNALMMFTSGNINCALATEHYAIKDLSRELTKKRIKDSAKIFAEVLGKKAPIALSALNPHAGDGGKLGGEEIKTIIPAVKELKKQGYNVEGPYPVDSLWQKHSNGMYKGILCMYHDAALTGLKLAAKKPVVHITAGLKFPRVSPTHGTAFDIAGKGKADESGMLAALNFAVEKYLS